MILRSGLSKICDTADHRSDQPRYYQNPTAIERLMMDFKKGYSVGLLHGTHKIDNG